MSIIRKFFKVNNTERKAIARERMETCKKCKFFNEQFGTCGTPYTGDDVIYRRKEYRTCGCQMHLKTQMPFSTCPVGKWGAMEGWGEEHYDAVKEAVENYENRPDKENLIRLYSVYKDILKEAGDHIDVTNISCGSCKANRLKDLKDYLKRFEKC